MSLKIRKNKRRLPKAIRPEEWGKLINTIATKDKIALISFLLAYGSGMRISEVVRCKPTDFQSDKMIIIDVAKYGVQRKVPIPKGWRQNFSQFIPICKNLNSQSSINAAVRQIQRRFEKYKKKANLNPLYTFHSLRHGFATRLLESGVPINQVQLALGHSDISTTGIYTKASPTDLLKSYEEKF